MRARARVCVCVQVWCEVGLCFISMLSLFVGFRALGFQWGFRIVEFRVMAGCLTLRLGLGH